MYVEQVNVNAGFFREAMSASAAPVPVPANGADNRSGFMDNLEQSSVTIDRELNKELTGIGNKNTTEDHGKEIAEKNDERRSSNYREETRANEEMEKTGEVKQPVKDRPQKQENQQQSQSGEKERAGDQENSPRDTGESKENKKITKDDLKENIKENVGQKIKELVKNHRLQVKEIKEVKEGMVENFRETKSIDTANNMEKLMLKNLESQNNPAKDKTGDQKSSGDEKTTGELAAEGKQHDPDIEIKAAKTTLKQEPRTNQKDHNSDNSAVNLLNHQLKEVRLVTETQVQKAVNQHQNALLEQYQEFKDNIAGGVENSIKFLIASGENRITMQLQPPELGKIQVELVIKDHHVTAKINTENHAVKEVIMTQLDQLKSNLENAGTQVNKFDVEVGGFRNQFDHQFAQEKSAGKHRGKQGSGQGQASFQEANDPGPGKVWNHHPLTYSLGRRINCLI